MRGKKFLAVVTAFSMLAAMAPQSFVANAAEAEYQIYPNPQSIEYEAGSFALDEKVNVVIESGIDEVTTDKVSDILDKNSLTGSTSSEVKAGTNILVGVYGSDGVVDNYAETNLTFDADIMGNYDAYMLDIDAEKEVITVLGKNTDGAFYGLVSLMHILDQSEGLKVRDLTIEDYADTSIRGFIEGYYGIPWSNEDRMSLMEFGGQFKMTSYVFAPKDDPYHTSKWRQLYPQEEIEAIKEMVEVGNANKCRFVWTAHPFMGGFNSGDVNGEIAALLAKFDQLYGAGVRQFGVLGDDVGSLNKNVVIQVMDAVSDWAAEKGDVYDSVFCPAGYNHAWQGDYSELNTYDAGFPDDVQIFWTGEAVCQPIIQQTLNHFRNQNATNGKRRAPLFWLNWPVNDINHSRMLMGKGSLLHTDINPEDLVGVVTNPMQEAEPSKVAIFAVADYAWNVADFNADKSWADSFAYIDADAAEELYTLAKHMSDPSPNGHGLNLAESEELLPLINEFKSVLSSGASLKEVGAELVEEMQEIIDACDNFHAKSKNERMKEQLLPFTNSLKDLATAIMNYTLAAMELEENDGSEAFGYYSAGFEAHDNSKKHAKQAKDGIEYVDPGSKYLMPLADAIKEAIADEVTAYVFGEAGSSVELTASSSFSSFYDGNINNIIDGKDNTHAWYGGFEAVGQYYQVSLSEPSTLYGVTILNGTASKPEDTFGVAEVQYTTDGTNWTKITGVNTYTPEVSVTDIAIENVIAVRYVCTGQGSGNKWPSMREFTLDLTGKKATVEFYTNTDLEGAVNATDNQFTLAPMTNITLEKDEYVGLKLDRIHEIKNTHLGTSIKAGVVEYSANGVEWTTELVDARYIRLCNIEDEAVTFDLTQFVVNTEEFEEKAVEATNYTSFDGNFSALFDNDWTTAYQFANSQNAGKYFTVDLGREIELNSFKAVCRDSEWDFPRHAKFSVSADGTNWTEIMTLGSQTEANPGESEGTDNINDVLTNHEISYNTESVDGLELTVRYLKFEITKTKVGPDKWVRFQEFEINGGAFISDANDPTVDGPGEAADNRYKFMTDADITTKYTFDSELVYRQSEENVNTVKFVQSGISNAVVKVRLAGEDTYRTLGILDEVICELAINGQIVDVKIVPANNKQVSITEMMFSYSEDAPDLEPDKEEVCEIYPDVIHGEWYEAAVQYVHDNGIMTGSNGLFKPTGEDGKLLRQQFVMILWRMEGEPAAKTDAAIKDLQDINGDEWYIDALCWAYENGVVTGVGGTMFKGSNPITRQQLATMMYRYADKMGYDTSKTADYSDMPGADDVESYAAEGMAWAVGSGIISGSGADKALNPTAGATRAQIATVIQRFCEENNL